MLNRLLSTALIGFLVIGINARKGTLQAASNWGKIGEHATTFNVNIAAAFDKNRIVTVGYLGEIQHTGDSAKTWLTGVNTSLCRFAVEIVDNNVMWCTGNGPQPRISLDGGRNWQEPKCEGLKGIGVCRFLSAFDGKNAWMSTGDDLLVTNDGGNKWEKIALPKNTDIMAMHLANSKEGYILDTDGSIRITKNGGATWNKRRFTDLSSFDRDKVSTQIAVIRFVENTGIVIVCTSKEKKLVVFKTTDGGKIWSREDLNEQRGAAYLSRDMNYFTILDFKNNIIVYQNML